MSEGLFETHRNALLVENNFETFAKIAEGNVRPEINPGRAEELELLLESTIESLMASGWAENRDIIRDAIAYYVADIGPLRAAAGLDSGIAASLAEKAEVMSILSPDVIDEFDRARQRDSRPSPSYPSFSSVGSGIGSEHEGPEDGPAADETSQERAARLQREAEEKRLDKANDDPEPVDDEDEVDPVEGQNDAQADDENEPDLVEARTGEIAENSELGAATTKKSQPKQRPKQSAREFLENTVNFEQICERIFNVRREGHYIVIVLGLETAGKTFFVRRLGHTIEEYVTRNIHGQSANFGRKTDRTRGIVYYDLSSSNLAKYPHIDLFDLPGEWFRDLAGAIENSSLNDDQRAGLCAILSAADMCVIVEPAMHVLAPALYQDEGDFAAELEILDYMKEGKSLGVADPQAYAKEKARQERIDQTELIAEFHTNLDTVRRRILNLRARLETAIAGEDLQAMRETIQAYLGQGFTSLEEINGPLPIPGLLLLSRADDYGHRAAQGDPMFDADPVKVLIEHARPKYKVYSRSFTLFGVDFITANKPSETIDTSDPEAARAYNRYAENAGVANILEDWMIPAMQTARALGPRRLRLRGPQAALMLRGLIEPSFRKSWKRSH